MPLIKPERPDEIDATATDLAYLAGPPKLDAARYPTTFAGALDPVIVDEDVHHGQWTPGRPRVSPTGVTTRGPLRPTVHGTVILRV